MTVKTPTATATRRPESMAITGVVAANGQAPAKVPRSVPRALAQARHVQYECV